MRLKNRNVFELRLRILSCIQNTVKNPNAKNLLKKIDVHSVATLRFAPMSYGGCKMFVAIDSTRFPPDRVELLEFLGLAVAAGCVNRLDLEQCCHFLQPGAKIPTVMTLFDGKFFSLTSVLITLKLFLHLSVNV